MFFNIANFESSVTNCSRKKNQIRITNIAEEMRMKQLMSSGKNYLLSTNLKSCNVCQLLRLPKNFDSGTGPSASSLLWLECLPLDLCFLSLFDLLELVLDLLDSSSSLLDDSEDELEELESDDRLLKCCK